MGLPGLATRSAPARLARFKAGRKVVVPIAVEFRHDGATLPPTMPNVMAARARVACTQARGVVRVKGARMVPGFNAEFWNAFAALSGAGQLRCLHRDGLLLLAVPMTQPSGSGVLVRLRREDLTILAACLSQGPSRLG